MPLPLQITFRGIPPSRIFENRIRELATRLEKFSAQITSCRVVIEAPHRHQSRGVLFDVRIDITVPGQVIAIHRAHSSNPAHQDAYVALRDSFSAARRRLQDYERECREPVKVRGTTVRQVGSRLQVESPTEHGG